MFVLHETLAKDTVEVCDWPLCKVLLAKDANYPWLILVPKREGLRDFHDLATDDRSAAMDEIDRASTALQDIYKPDKINVGALGNMVEQLHIHVVARFKTDPAWPGPVWGAVPARAYGPEELDGTLMRLRAELT